MKKGFKKAAMWLLIFVLAMTAMPGGMIQSTTTVQAAAKKTTAKKTSFAKKKLTLKKGQKKTAALKSKKKGNKYTWKSSKPSIVAVSKKGVLTARKKGSAVITCIVKPKKGKKYSLKMKVTVKAPSKKKNSTTSDAIKAAEDAKAKAEADSKAAADAKAKAEADSKAAADAKAKAEADSKAAADAKAKAEADSKAAVDAKAKAEADSKAATDAKAKAEADSKAAADAKAKAEADSKAAADAKAKAEADSKAAIDAKTKAEAEVKAAVDTKTKAEAELKAANEAKAKADATVKAANEAKNKAEAELKAANEAKAKATTDSNATAAVKEQAEATLKTAMEAQAKAEAELKAANDIKTKADERLSSAEKTLAKAEVLTKNAEDAKTKTEAELKAANDAKAKAEADAKAANDAKTKAEADAKAANDAKTKAEADAKAANDAKVKAEADAKAANDAKVKAETDAKAANDAKAKAEADAKAANDAKTKAETELKAANEAKAKAEADAKAANDARVKAEADAKAANDAKDNAIAAAKKEKEAREKAEAEVKAAKEEKAKAEAEKKAAEELSNKLVADAETAKNTLIDLDKTKLIDLGFVQYVAVSYANGYSRYNTRMIVDGVDVTSAVTSVSDDGTVAKWEITSVNPASLTIESIADNTLHQTVKLSDNANPQAPVVRKSTSPDYVLGYGALSYWDYYLTNYDDEGNMRIHASKTTFSRNAETKKADHPYYAPDADLSTDGGNVVIMFNYNTDEEKTWFDAIPETGALELVSYDQFKNVLNGNLVYEKTTEPHGKGTVGEFIIKAGQGNFTNAGRYYVRIRPEKGQAVLTSIQLVNEVAPTMTLSESRALESGQNIHFRVNNMTYAIKDPIERVELTDPDGNVHPLTYIDDYFLFGDLFVLYNDVTRDDGNGINHTEAPGNYTITVYAEGFKPMSYTFQIVDNPRRVGTSDSVKSLDLVSVEVDAVSSASLSGGSTSSGSGSSGGGSIAANLVFNVDLYANAEIFDKLDLGNAYATAIVDRYETQITGFTAVYTKDGENFYDFSDYFNAVQQSKLTGTYLSFADYKASAAAKTINKPTKVKEVLEDNLLGELIEDNSYYGNEAPTLQLVDAQDNPIDQVAEGTDAIYKPADDTAYLKKLEGIYTSTQWYAPLENGWKVEDNRLILENKLLSLKGDNQFTVRVPGYQDATLTVPYTKVLEEITLELAETRQALTGQDVTIKLTGSKGDFAKYLTHVSLNNGLSDKSVHTQSYGGSTSNDWYEFNEDKTELTLKGGLFKRAGSYTLTLSADYYDALTLEFPVTFDPDEEGSLPAPKAVKLTDNGNSYLVEFEKLTDENGNEQDAAEYLKHLDDYSVIVGSTEYTHALLSLAVNTFQATCADPAYGGSNNCLKLHKSGFSTEEVTTVTLRADGYQTQTFTVNADGTLEGAEKPEPVEPETPVEQETKATPNAIPTIYASSYPSYLQFSSYQNDFTEWLGSLSEKTVFTVNGTVYSYSSDAWYGAANTWAKGSSSLVMGGKLTEEDNIITVQTTGYETVYWNVTCTTSAYSGTTTYSVSLSAPEIPAPTTEDPDTPSSKEPAQGETSDSDKDTTPEPASTKKAAPEITPDTYYASYPGYLQFSNSQADFTEWLSAVSEESTLIVNGTDYDFASNAWYGAANTWYKGTSTPSLIIASGNLTEGVNTIEIKTADYETITWYLTCKKDYYSGTTFTLSLTAPESNTGEVTAPEAASSASGFFGNDSETSTEADSSETSGFASDF